jgi:hypothetical protein
MRAKARATSAILKSRWPLPISVAASFLAENRFPLFRAMLLA